MRDYIERSTLTRINEKKLTWQHSTPYGSRGRVFRCIYNTDYDWIGHNCYASSGQSGSSLFIARKNGSYYEGGVIFAIHRDA